KSRRFTSFGHLTLQMKLFFYKTKPTPDWKGPRSGLPLGNGGVGPPEPWKAGLQIKCGPEDTKNTKKTKFNLNLYK
ncbi:MAG: hypothetical protein II103_02275, partial [Treponema sp.]|nr:hypothetical protein [Treponema sp.]